MAESLSLTIAGATFAVLITALEYDKSLAGFQLISSVFLPTPTHSDLAFGVDGFSLTLALLLLFIFPACLLTAGNISDRYILFVSLLGLMEVLLLLAFTALDLL